MPIYRPNSWRALLVAVFKRQAALRVPTGGGAIMTELSEDLLTEAGDTIILET